MYDILTDPVPRNLLLRIVRALVWVLRAGWDLRTAIFRAILAFVTAQAAYTSLIKNTQTKAALESSGVKDTDAYDAQHDRE